MGFDVLPVLVDALDDATSSRMPIYDYGKRPIVGSGSLEMAIDEMTRNATQIGEWKVNQLVGTLIYTLADREFVVVRGKKEYRIQAIGEKPELVPQFQKLILQWYAENAKKSPLERKIADLQSSVPYNRYLAIWWIGNHNEKRGRDAVAARMEAILADKASIPPSTGELVQGALTLGQLGEVASVDVVRRICNELSDRVDTPGGDVHRLFTAYQGLALLGKKDEALMELQHIPKRYAAKWNPDIDKIHQRSLTEARKKW
jgi:hypothetical protein